MSTPPKIGFGRPDIEDPGTKTFTSSVLGVSVVIRRNALVVWHLLVLAGLAWLVVRSYTIEKKVDSHSGAAGAAQREAGGHSK